MKNSNQLKFVIATLICILFCSHGYVNLLKSQSAKCTDAPRTPDILLRENFDFSRAISWFENKFRIFESHWRDYGYGEYDLSRPYAKTLNSALLLYFGLSDDPNQWHYAEDYKKVGYAIETHAHYQFNYVPSDNTDWLAYADFDNQQVLLSCNLFVGDSLYNNPATRVGDFIHEGWHFWQWKNGFETHHIDGCEAPNRNCDYYYPHGIGDFTRGEIYKWGYNSDGELLFHSPNQVQVEYLCDLAEHAASFVPTVIRELAKAEANQRLSTRFKNAVAYRCGDPRPW